MMSMPVSQESCDVSLWQKGVRTPLCLGKLTGVIIIPSKLEVQFRVPELALHICDSYMKSTLEGMHRQADGRPTLACLLTVSNTTA